MYIVCSELPVDNIIMAFYDKLKDPRYSVDYVRITYMYISLLISPLILSTFPCRKERPDFGNNFLQLASTASKVPTY